MDIACNGLSIAKGMRSLAHVESVSVKKGDAYIPLCKLVIDTYGELELRIKAGQITSIDTPVNVYDCDVFKPSVDATGRKIIKEYEPAFPRTEGARIIGSFVRYSTPHGSDLKILDIADVDRRGPDDVNLYAFPRVCACLGDLDLETVNVGGLPSSRSGMPLPSPSPLASFLSIGLIYPPI